MSLADEDPIAIPASSAFARNRRLATGVVSGVLTKAAAFALTLVTVPMTLGYLGPERYGIWITMVSMLAWLSLMDLGIANGLTPALSAAFGRKRDDLAREYVSTAFWSLAGIAAVSVLLIASVWSLVEWEKLFRVSDPGSLRDVSLAMALAVVFFLLNLPLAVNQRVLLAYQEGKKANIAQLLTSFAGVLGIYVATFTKGGLVALVLGYSGSQVLMAAAVSVWLFTKEKPQLRPTVLPKAIHARTVFSYGGLYLVMQLGALLVLQKDLFLISWLLGAADAAAYGVAWQLFMYVGLVNLLLAPYVSPGFGEASAAGDSTWVRKTYRRYVLGTMATTALAAIVIGLFYELIVQAWVGKSVLPTEQTIWWLAAWSMANAFFGPSIALLQGLGRLRRFTAYHFAAAAASFILSLWLLPVVGVHGGVMASTLCFVVILAIPTLQEVRRGLGQAADRQPG